MNATIQCLRTVPELLQAMELMEPPRGQDQHANLTIAMRSLFQLLNKSGDSVPPLVFLQVLRSVFPQFAESNNHGFMQQDAEECWGQIVHALSDRVPALTPTGEVAKEGHFVDQFMSTEVISTTTCDEVPEEPAATTIETFNKMRVNIGPGVSTYLVSEIAASLTEKIEKNSPTLNRSSVYTKTSKISRLPQYLAINFVRFQWKPQERVKAKILKRVQFPFELDMTPFCTTELQHKLAPAKQRLKEVAEKKADEKVCRKRKKQAPAGDVEMTPAEGSSSAAPTAADAKKKHMAVLEEIGVEPSFLQDPGVNPSGQYDLVAVLTHMGRAADSGHYIGWAKQEGSDNWWKYDDDKVSQVKQEAITKLEGGGDWHTAYICLYRAKMLE
nr:hypothetical protein HK105_003620 [Polyrhizophydium stewartii]